MSQTTNDALNKLCKWRTILVGWQLGTRADGDPESEAVRDHRDATMLLRAELTALIALLIKKGVFTSEQYEEELGRAARELDKGYERLFPGIRTTSDGVEFYDLVKAGETMKGWKP